MNYIEDFIKYLKVIKKDSNHTLINYKDDLIELHDFNTDLININEVLVSEYLEYLYSKGLNRNTISRKLSAIRSFYNYLLQNNIVKTNYFKEISNPKKNKALPKYAKDGTATYRRIELPISEEEGSNSKNDEGFFDKISRYGEEIISGILNFLGIKN